MKIRFKEYKSDILWKNYQRLVLLMDRVDQNSKDWEDLNKIAWEIIEKYVDELQKEFIK